MIGRDGGAGPSAWALRYARFLHRRASGVIAACLIVTGLSVALASKLSISTDLAALLPRGYPSVEDLHKLLARIGGTASLTIAIESPDLEASERFADALVVEIKKDLGGEIANLDYKVDALASFYRKHAAVYLSKADLLGIEADLERGIADAKLKASPLPYDLELDDAPKATAPARPFAGVKKRLDDAQKEYARYPDGYFASDKEHLLAIFIRPRASGADPKIALPFVAKIKAIVARVDPRKFGDVKVQYTGAFQVSLDEQQAIIHDLLSTAGLCVGLIVIALMLYFRLIRVVVLLGATLVCGCAWAFGLAAVAVGYLNMQTAFLGSIIAGTGINYGIILLARYLEERRRGVDEEGALARALATTWVGTLTAAATTAVSFGTLLVAGISSFRHFAIIGGGGILFCWLLSFSLLPALLQLSERLVPMLVRPQRAVRWPSVLVELPLRFPRQVIALSLLASAGAIVAFVHFLPNALETDGRNLRNKSSGTSEASRLGDRVADLRGTSTSPGFIVTDSLADAKRVCDVLNARVKREGKAAPLDHCTSLYSLLPDEPTEKLAIARRILARLDELPPDAVTGEDKQALDELRADLVLEDVRLEDLPEELTRPFREVSGEVGRLVGVIPVGGRDLWIQENLFAFTDAIRRIDIGDGQGGERVVTSSGDLVIFADILRMITRDAPRTTALALFAVIVFVLVALRGGRATAHVVGALVIGVLWMVGIASLDHVKINFFNFVALPTTFGIAVDYTINVYTRYRGSARAVRDDDPRRLARLREALSETGGAVFLCSVTTIIGYATLIIANNMALVSFGKLAILGELTCVVAALFLLPATLLTDRNS